MGREAARTGSRADVSVFTPRGTARLLYLRGRREDSGERAGPGRRRRRHRARVPGLGDRPVRTGPRPSRARGPGRPGRGLCSRDPVREHAHSRGRSPPSHRARGRRKRSECSAALSCLPALARGTRPSAPSSAAPAIVGRSSWMANGCRPRGCARWKRASASVFDHEPGARSHGEDARTWQSSGGRRRGGARPR